MIKNVFMPQLFIWLCLRSCKGDRVWILGFYFCYACFCYVWLQVVHDANSSAGMNFIFFILFLCILVFYAIRNHFVFQATILSVSCLLFVGLDPDTFPHMMFCALLDMKREAYGKCFACCLVFYYCISFGYVSVVFC